MPAPGACEPQSTVTKGSTLRVTVGVLNNSAVPLKFTLVVFAVGAGTLSDPTGNHETDYNTWMSETNERYSIFADDHRSGFSASQSPTLNPSQTAAFPVYFDTSGYPTETYEVAAVIFCHDAATENYVGTGDSLLCRDAFVLLD